MPLRKTAPLILSTTSFLLLGTVLGNAQTTSIWDGSIGLWNNAARWSTSPLVPNGNFIAELNSGTAALSSPISLAGLNLNGGNVVTDSSLTVNNASLQGGSLTGDSAATFNGTVDFGPGTFTIGGSGVKTFAGSTAFGESDAYPTLYLEGGATLRNTGSFLHRTGDGVTGYSSQIYFNTDSTGPSVLRNEAVGTFTAAIAAGSSGFIYPSGGDPGNMFQNAGGFVKTGAGEYSVGVAFANTGTVDVQAGRLTLNGDNFTNEGAVQVSEGAVLAATSTFTQSVSGLIAGTGTIESPTMTLSGTVSPGFSPGTLTLAGDVELTTVAVLQFELGPQAGPNDFLSITGSLVLDGMLNIVALPGLQTGIYNLMTAGGGITNQGLEFGQVPQGFTGNIGIIGNVVQLQVLTLPVPETSSSLLMLLAAAGLTSVRRRPAARQA
ncbi:MAG: protein containing Outer rane autotransporter barrel domain [Verrucomicrobiales bacterium]|nr:protein containing Outer rane autotransporter barrel domain [Verrucomicrobiales bacterium]